MMTSETIRELLRSHIFRHQATPKTEDRWMAWLLQYLTATEGVMQLPSLADLQSLVQAELADLTASGRVIRWDGTYLVTARWQLEVATQTAIAEYTMPTLRMEQVSDPEYPYQAVITERDQDYPLCRFEDCDQAVTFLANILEYLA